MHQIQVKAEMVGLELLHQSLVLPLVALVVAAVACEGVPIVPLQTGAALELQAVTVLQEQQTPAVVAAEAGGAADILAQAAPA
jgi:hypothetical protein